MSLDLARWQFALTSINHFFFVPVTIGLAFLTALLQTSWQRRGEPAMLRLTRFFGTLLLINVAVGVVTGIVQEFEFGMNWSAYSRLVGNIFGAPLAMEGLLAFFLESTFLGLWIFGWDRLSRRAHLATIWLVAFGTVVSAAFIMMANSWMQHPVGYVMVGGKPLLNDIWAVMANPVFLWSYAHVLLISLVTGALVMLAVAAWQLRGGPAAPTRGTPASPETAAFVSAARIAIMTLLPGIIAAMAVGSELGVIEATYQPMKIAAAEAQWNTCQPCSFSLFQIRGGNNDHAPTQLVSIPHLLSVLATNTWDGRVIGLNQLQARYVKRYGPGYYIPNVFIQYWSMRLMAYLAGLIFLLAVWGLWLLLRGKIATSRVFLLAATWAVVTPFLMNTAGWLLTESGRQPWVVQGLMLTSRGASPTVSVTELWISVVAFVAIYLALAIVDATLTLRYSRRPLPEAPPPSGAAAEAGRGTGGAEEARVPSMLY